MSDPNHSRSLLRSLGMGKLVYAVWHRPVGELLSLIREGGPLVRRNNRLGREAMEKAAHRLPPLKGAGPAITLHLLTGRKFWYQTAFCLHSFARTSGRALQPVVYDDGTLDGEVEGWLRRLFPEIVVISRSQAVQRLDSILPAEKYPYLRERWQNYPNIRKLIDPHIGSSGWKLVIDSDLLFFHQPTFLTAWADAPSNPLHAVDVMTSYGYSPALLEGLAGHRLAEKVNVGLCGLESSSLDWDTLESWTRSLTQAEGTSYYLEQALVAMLVAGKHCSIAPAGEYITLPQPPEATDCGAIMHHYVANSKRWYFQHNWRRFEPDSA